MNKTFIAAVSIALGLACSFGSVQASEKNADKTLADIHGAMWPAQEAGGWATKAKCLQCHGSYDALAEKTKDLVPNPHYSHLGEVNCQDCHQPQLKAKDTKLMCNSCHKFDVKKKAPAAKAK